MKVKFMFGIALFALTLFAAISVRALTVVGPQQPSTSATLSWSAPATNTDGTPLTDLAGYYVYTGLASRTYTSKFNVGLVTTYTVTSLPTGTSYFAVTAYNSVGTESAYSNEVSKYIDAEIPSAPANLTIVTLSAS